MENDKAAKRPVVITLCGSTRFGKAFEEANLKLTLAGNIVLSVGCMTQSDKELKITEEQKIALDNLHLRKIDLSNAIYVLNVDGYIGKSTAREVAYAVARNRGVLFLEPEAGEKWLEANAHDIAKQVVYFVSNDEVQENV